MVSERFLFPISLSKAFRYKEEKASEAPIIGAENERRYYIHRVSSHIYNIRQWKEDKLFAFEYDQRRAPSPRFFPGQFKRGDPGQSAKNRMDRFS